MRYQVTIRGQQYVVVDSLTGFQTLSGDVFGSKAVSAHGTRKSAENAAQILNNQDERTGR